MKFIVGTGGPLTRLPGGLEALLRLVGGGRTRELYPRAAVPLLDRRYIMAMCGVLSRKFPDKALELLFESLGIKP